MHKLEDKDIVYVLKDAAYNEELRYSLRSVDQNFPHRTCWFYGAKPVGLKPDECVLMPQEGARKWDRVRGMLKAIAENDEITKDFVLFNDDFFVMSKVTELPYTTCGTLAELCVHIEVENNCKPTPYTAELKKTIKAIQDKHWNIASIDNYELHAPMIFNRKKLLEVIEMFPENRGTRSLYGNYLSSRPDENEGTENEELFDFVGNDVKVWKIDQVPYIDPVFPYLSTDDSSFERGAVGEYIRRMFPDKSRFER